MQRGCNHLVEQSLSHGGNIYHAARESSREALDFCDFSASINPLGIPASVQRTLRNAAPKILHYPDPDGLELRQAIARRHRIRPEHVVLGNGTTELIYTLPSALDIRHGLIIGPTFSEYERALILAGSQVTAVSARSNDNYRPPINEALEMMKSSRPSSRELKTRNTAIDAVFLCNPNSPTGQSVSRNMVYRALGDVKQRNGRLIVDETFVDFCEEKSVVSRAARDDSLLVLRSFTKFYGIPGLRVGYAVGTESVIRTLQDRLPPWSVNVLAQEAALACLSDHRYKAKSLRSLERNRERFRRQLHGIPRLQVYPSFANFLLVELPKPLTSRLVTGVLMEYGLLVRDCSNYPGLNARTLRFAVRTPKENARLINRLRQVVSAGK